MLATEQITGHISGHMLWFYSPKTQEECKSQQERDEREGVAHGVHQLQGGQQGIVLHLDMGRADMTTRMQSVTPPSPQLHAQSHPGATHELRHRLSLKPVARPFLLNSVGTQIGSPNCLGTLQRPQSPVGKNLVGKSLMPWLGSQPSTHSPGLAISEGTEP